MDTSIKKERELKKHLYAKCLENTGDKEFSKRVSEKEAKSIMDGVKGR